MRIVGPNASPPGGAPAAPRRASSGGFSIAEQQAPTSATPVAALRTIGGIDALIALQGEHDPAARRRRAVKRGRAALDVLDELKTEVLAGTLGPSTLMRLKSAGADLCDATGDAGLDAVLAEIDLRLAVEIAKMSASK
jgi:Class II flagellar assembly regulator